MAKLKGMKYREIAQDLNLSEKTIENQMTKAIKLLRLYLAANRQALMALLTPLFYQSSESNKDEPSRRYRRSAGQVLRQ